MNKILLIDDDRDICLLLNRFLSKKGFEVTELYSGKKAISWLESNQADLILCDFRLEDMDASSLLPLIKEKNPDLPVVIITGYAEIKTAVKMMKMGAYDYITKPLLPEEIVLTIRQALGAGGEKQGSEYRKINAPIPLPAREVSSGKTEEHIFGNSETFHNILKQIDLVGPTGYSVIIYGETGSGKESIAQKIHQSSHRAGKPFMAIDCGVLSKELASSELFGHEKGSFTGAVTQKIGCFELANGGTIFLDEVSNLPYDVQVALLRVVQERKMRRVGGTQDIALDVRIIVASNEPLWNNTRNGKFREDLFHRFNEFSIELPPLRERGEDIMLFANHFLKLTNEELRKNIEGFAPEVVEIFNSYAWHGNLRELKNIVRRAALLTPSGLVETKALPFEIIHFKKFREVAAKDKNAVPGSNQQGAGLSQSSRNPAEVSLKEASMDAEYEMIMQALKESNYNKSKAAQLLKIDRKTLYNKMTMHAGLKSR
jgi:two-component system response regulator HydG